MIAQPDATGPDEDDRPTRDRLLDAAYELLVDEGYHAATVQSVARRAHLTTGAIYANFANKHELLVQAVLRRWSRSPQAAPLRIAPGGDADEADVGLGDLSALLAGQLSTPPEPEHRLLTEVTGAAMRDPGPSPLQEGARTLAAVLRTAVERGKAAGVISDDFTTDALVALMVCLHLGTITSKSWGLRQIGEAEAREVLAALSRSLAPPRAGP